MCSVFAQKKQIEAINGRLLQMESQDSLLMVQVGNLSKENQELKNKLGFLEGEYNKLSGQFSNLSTQFEALANEMEEIKKQPKEAVAEAPKYEVVGEVSNGMVIVREGLLYGYINAAGEYIIPAQYEEARAFVDGYARVKKNDKWGVVGIDGKEIIPCEYDRISHYNGTVWKVNKGELYGLYSAVDGSVVQPIKYTTIDRIYGERALMCVNGKYGYFDPNGKVAIAAQYTKAFSFRDNGQALVVSANGHIYINKNGEVVGR
jgi:hypothetical protein